MIKNIFRIALLIILVFLIVIAIYIFHRSRTKKPQVQIPPMQVTVQNEDNSYGNCCGLVSSYPFDFVKMKSISFGTDKTDLYIKFQLGSKLPSPDKLPSYHGDKLTGMTYYMDLDENYYDSLGRKNPSGFDSALKISFYGTTEEETDTDRLTIQGQRVAGGPGYDYFVVKFPYEKVLFSQSGPDIVFDAYSLAISEKHRAGASKNAFKNTKLAADGQNTSEIKIPLSLSK
jgi:hypothetical protein